MKLFTSKETFSFKLAKNGRTYVRDAKGHFVTHFKHKSSSFDKAFAAQKISTKYNEPVSDKKYVGGHPGEGKEKKKEGEGKWLVQFTKTYDSKKSSNEITYEAHGTFDYEPDPQKTVDYIQKSFAGTFHSGKQHKGMPSNLFHALADSEDIVSGMEIRETGEDGPATNQIDATLVFQNQKTGKAYKYSN